MSNEWRPIVEYEIPPEELADGELRALAGVWIEQKSRLEKSKNMERFMERFRREWAIETGLIERLYTLSHGVTESLILHGVKVDLIPHRESNNPQQVVDLINDQWAALQSVFAFVKGKDLLSISYIKEMHQLFTRRQQYAEAYVRTLDKHGNEIRSKKKTELIRGAYKQLPNNPTRPDGTIHHYCPPEHTVSEMDELLRMHHGHNAAPEVEAAWLHHRFTQIHPFQDGNGRVARALATLIFLKADLFPLVVRNRDRNRYIDALETADNGNLRPLVSFFTELQRQAFISAISIAHDTEKSEHVDALAQAITQQLVQKKSSIAQESKIAMQKTEYLQNIAKTRMEEICSYIMSKLEGNEALKFYVDSGDDQGNQGHYHRSQIITTAKHLNYFANTRSYRSWIRLGIEDDSTATQSNILIAFHGLGQQFQGIIACSGTWFQRVPGDNDDRKTRELVGEIPLCDAVFQINYKEDIRQIEQRFQDWLERVMERGLAMYRTTIE